MTASPLSNPRLRRFALIDTLATLAVQMQAAAVGWQLFDATDSAFALGLVGLVQVIPAVALALPAGRLADRLPRRDLAIGAFSAFALGSAALFLVTAAHLPVAWVYAIMLWQGIARAFATPAVGAYLPQLVAPGEFVQANALLSSLGELASIVGPALGGWVIARLGVSSVYATSAVFGATFVVLLATLPRFPAVATGEVETADELFAGLRFVARTKVFLAAITLDLFAVLFGGATALLPLFAKDVLHVGPTGFGWLRAAPSLGAMLIAVVQTRLPPWKRPGMVLLWVVAGFGAATVVFGLSTSFPLSMAMLVLAGMFDNVSVVIRSTLEQVLTPEALRGRVSAVHHVFIGLSNELGSFESGASAALLGPVVSVVGGGTVTLLVVGAVVLLWPQVARLGRLEDLQPEPILPAP